MAGVQRVPRGGGAAAGQEVRWFAFAGNFYTPDCRIRVRTPTSPQFDPAQPNPTDRPNDAPPAEKQVAILQRALESHPASEPLLLALLRAYALCAEPEALHGKWEAVLRRRPGSWALWREYLALRCAGRLAPVRLGLL